MRSFLRHLTHLYLVLAVLAGVPAGASRAVLCIGPSGHMAIEDGEAHCGASTRSSSGDVESADDFSVPGGCGDCVDFPMGKQTLHSAYHLAPSAGASVTLLAAGVQDVHLSDLFIASPRLALARVESLRLPFPPSRTTILRN